MGGSEMFKGFMETLVDILTELYQYHTASTEDVERYIEELNNHDWSTGYTFSVDAHGVVDYEEDGHDT